jgi:hypothetical protein
VDFQTGLGNVSVFADLTLEWTFSRVRSQMQFQIKSLGEALAADVAHKRSISSVLFYVDWQTCGVGKLGFAIITNVFQQGWIALFFLMDLHVFQQAVFSVTTFIAYFANEGLLSAVLKHVFIEQGGVNKAFLANFAFVRFLIFRHMSSHVIV